jgi:hypothetical protein
MIFTAKQWTDKIFRMCLDHRILPAASIRGGGCAGRNDEMYSQDAFFAN